MSHNFGQAFGADQAFAACAGGLTIAEYCNKPPADLCCGVCNNIPITGFGTFLNNLFGTLFALMIALYWKVETPYSLAFQFLSADGMVLSLLLQFYNSYAGTHPLSLFHYCFVPLSAISPIPIMVATSIAKLEYLHTMSSAAAGELAHTVAQERKERARRKKEEEGGRPSLRSRFSSSRSLSSKSKKAAAASRSSRPHTPGSVLAEPVQMNSLGEIIGKKPHKGKEPVRSKSEPIIPSKKHDDASSISSVKTHDTLHDRLPRPWLPQLAKWVTLGHLIFYSCLFLTVFIGLKDTSQSNCIDTYHLNQWRLNMAVFCFTYLILIGAWAWSVLFRALSSNHRLKTGHYDGLQVMVYDVLRLTHIHRWGERNPKNLEHRLMGLLKGSPTTWRYCISITAYLLWAVPYAAIYLSALDKFILFGTNPMPYEQVSAAVGIIAPLSIVARTWMENRDGWNDKKKLQHEFGEVDELAERNEQAHNDIVRHSSSASGGVGPSGHHNLAHPHQPGGGMTGNDNGGVGPSGHNRTGSSPSDGDYFNRNHSSAFPPDPFPHPPHHDRPLPAVSIDDNDSGGSSSPAEDGQDGRRPPRRSSQHSSSSRMRPDPSLQGDYARAQVWLDRNRSDASMTSKKRGKRPVRD